LIPLILDVNAIAPYFLHETYILYEPSLPIIIYGSNRVPVTLFPKTGLFEYFSHSSTIIISFALIKIIIK
jgi:hypothetical protein